MGSELQDLAPQLFFLLVGGLAASLGPGWWAGRWGRARLARTGGWVVALASLGLVAVAAGGLYWMVRDLGERFLAGPATISPLRFLLAGILVGLPLSLPTVLASWHGARRDSRKPARAPATRDERRAFADRIGQQIRDATRPPREVEASIVGDGGRVLLLEGDLKREEGDRLVAALRGELEELGFKRVQGKGTGGDWWTRV